MPLAFDPKPNNPALGQLVRLHADIGGKIHENKKAAVKLAADMMHVEAVIRMFDPAYDVRRIAVKRKRMRNPWFKRGTMFREVAGVLRAAAEPLGHGIFCRSIAQPRGNPAHAEGRDNDKVDGPSPAGGNSMLQSYQCATCRTVSMFASGEDQTKCATCGRNKYPPSVGRRGQTGYRSRGLFQY